MRVRGVESLERPVDSAHGVARVALNLVGDDLDGLDRGDPLLTPVAWHHTEVVDVRLRSRDGSTPPERPLLHVGAASVATHCRPLGDDLVRLTLDRPLPLRVGDRALLRDPGDRRIWGVRVLDPAPPRLARRGAAARRADALAGHRASPTSPERSHAGRSSRRPSSAGSAFPSTTRRPGRPMWCRRAAG